MRNKGIYTDTHTHTFPRTVSGAGHRPGRGGGFDRCKGCGWLWVVVGGSWRWWGEVRQSIWGVVAEIVNLGFPESAQDTEADRVHSPDLHGPVFLWRRTMAEGLEQWVRVKTLVLWPHEIFSGLWRFHPIAFFRCIIGGDRAGVQILGGDAHTDRHGNPHQLAHSLRSFGASRGLCGGCQHQRQGWEKR